MKETLNSLNRVGLASACYKQHTMMPGFVGATGNLRVGKRRAPSRSLG